MATIGTRSFSVFGAAILVLAALLTCVCVPPLGGGPAKTPVVLAETSAPTPFVLIVTATPAPTKPRPATPTLTRTPRPTQVPPPTATPSVLKPIPTPLPLSEPLRARAHGATIRIAIPNPDGSWWVGTGTVVGFDGRTFVTAFHVVGDKDTGQLSADEIWVGPFMDWTLRARILETASEKDLAVLRVEGDFPGFAIVPMGDSDKLKLGDTVYTLSYPEVAQGSLEMTSGVVLSLIRENGKLIYIMTDAMASPGSSGGVAINAQGELIGIVTAILEDKEALEKLGYPELSELTVLVPVNEAKPLVAKAMQK